MQVYKVVAKRGQRLASSHAWGELEVAYKPGQWAEAPVGGLLAFDSFEAARAFALRQYPRRRQVWEAEADEAVPLPAYCLIGPTSTARARAVWEQNKRASARWPEGTVAYRRLRLLRRVA
jgi:hypothetical protein